MIEFTSAAGGDVFKERQAQVLAPRLEAAIINYAGFMLSSSAVS